jgi:hypothetical protein
MEVLLLKELMKLKNVSQKDLPKHVETKNLIYFN